MLNLINIFNNSILANIFNKILYYNYNIKNFKLC